MEGLYAEGVGGGRREAVGGRGGGSSQDVALLQQAVCGLRDELARSRSESQRSMDQLACLISLVRKAWAGDQHAVNHVARIVGFSPPEYDSEYMEARDLYIGKPKKAAVHHWALLSVGLLNRDYRKMEIITENKQKLHLRSREAYLDSELALQHTIMKPERVRSAKLHQGHCMQRASRPTSKQSQSESYIPFSAQMAPLHTAVQIHQRAASDVKLITTELDSRHPNTPSAQPDNIGSQDETQRYTKVGLFDPDNVIHGQSSRRRRPFSGGQQRYSDAHRARPKSAVTLRPERPLKYETTRPIVAPPSGRPARKSAVRRRSADGRRGEAGVQSAGCKSVVSFADDLQRTDDLHRDFEASYRSLQKKLCIDDNGFV